MQELPAIDEHLNNIYVAKLNKIEKIALIGK